MKKEIIVALLSALACGSAAASTTSLSFSTSHKDAFVSISGQDDFAGVIAITPAISNGLTLSFSATDGTFDNVRYTFYSDATLTTAIGSALGYQLRTTPPSLSTSFSAGSALTEFSDFAKTSFDLSASTPYYVKITGTLKDADAYGQLKLSVGNAVVTAVPEPESYAMLLAGLGVMATIARRRNRPA